ncbi:unnamed protein product (macronuclear) [Paramecium tetraurelia]|uniref:Uncharacterized protein n=1 Tax=Paramecium tetraurelia TaxID=5888 RepID=A0E254_PARTE|nr:uncharacterized protein GSPATT00022543001 [Paramecium tetraurelia]CAK89371.1 unnamed protein product [Paramecium tetraurelia]|eukprot:XP_001456768.1 hypothetical protein (macronuclear) [Paramecium tetraurelia strain d4-2]
MQQLHKFSNKSVQQIVQELMYDEYLERDNMLRNAFNSSPLKAVKKKIVFSKNIYNNYLQQSPSSVTSQNNQCKVIGVVAIQKKKNQDAIINVSNVKKVNKPKELRGLSISDHMDNVIRDKNNLPQIQRQSQKSLVFNDDDFEGYKLKSEEMTLEIDEYMKMKKDKDSFSLPNIYSRYQ